MFYRLPMKKARKIAFWRAKVKPETIVFYKSYYDAVSDLPEKMQLSLYKSIFSYTFEGLEPELSGMTNTIWKLIKPTIDASVLNYKNGKKGGRPKTGVPETEKGGFPEIENRPFEKPETNKDYNKNKDKDLNKDYPADFEKFWNVYPKKVGKADAAKKFQKALKIVPADIIIEAVGRYCKSKTVTDGFVCNPATWLHQERWNDLEAVALPDDPNRPPGAVRKTASGWWVDKNGAVVVKPEFS